MSWLFLRNELCHSSIDTEPRNLRDEEAYPHSLINDGNPGTASATADRALPPNARFAYLRLPRYAADAEMATWLNIRRAYDVDMAANASLRTVGTGETDLTRAT
jgi:hypothetical protein